MMPLLGTEEMLGFGNSGFGVSGVGVPGVGKGAGSARRRRDGEGAVRRAVDENRWAG